MAKTDNIFDVCVVGAGPAGLMAAGRAAEMGAKVVLIEKNQKPGRKLLLTGNGRCNLTNAKFNIKELAGNYTNGSFLFHCFSVFEARQTIEFFEKLGLKTKIEAKDRVFPQSDQAGDVLNALIKYIDKNRVEKLFDSQILDADFLKGKIIKIILKDREIVAKNYIFCTGGKSYPETGSSGQGYELAKKFGHKISQLRPAEVPLRLKEEFVTNLQGVGLKNTKITAISGKNKISETGEIMFTHFGVSGPAALNITLTASDFIGKEGVKLVLDFFPEENAEVLSKRIVRIFEQNPGKMFKNFCQEIIPLKLALVVANISAIKEDDKASGVSKDKIKNFTKNLKTFELTPSGLLSFDAANVTSGGVDIKEIDHKTMRSKIIKNLYFAGEIINVHGKTGGFNLQACWSTGRLAGESSAILK